MGILCLVDPKAIKVSLWGTDRATYTKRAREAKAKPSSLRRVKLMLNRCDLDIAIANHSIRYDI